MLVLSRKPGERIRIGKDIEIVVKRIRGTSLVSIGIEAPKETKILRGELQKGDEPMTA